MACKIPIFFLLSLFFAIVSAGCENVKGVADFSKPDINFKDVTIANGVCARLYVPKSVIPNQKVPLVVYYHGGAFRFFSAFDSRYDEYISSLVKKANIIALSVEYRLASLEPIATPFDDSWAALKWVASHSNGQGPEEWVNSVVDFKRVYLSGDSAGATISHNMAIKIESEKLDGLSITGMALIHPYFWGSKPIGKIEPQDETARAEISGMWIKATRGTLGLDDPHINPLADPKLSSLACNKVFVITAKNDTSFRDRGVYYLKALRTNGWKGKTEFMETSGYHTFHLDEPSSKDAQHMLKRVSSFYNSS